MFNIGDRVVINSKMGNNIIPIIGTIVERFAGRENYHNGDTELCYGVAPNDPDPDEEKVILYV